MCRRFGSLVVPGNNVGALLLLQRQHCAHVAVLRRFWRQRGHLAAVAGADYGAWAA